jgi:predicted ATPase/DNA-binding SARP family transcriptional activator
MHPHGVEQETVARCCITLLGSFSVKFGGKVVSRFRSKATASLLAFLAFHRGRTFPREILAEMFWPNVPQEASRRNLSVALWSLRRLFESDSAEEGSILLVTPHLIGIEAASVATDVAMFEAAITSAKVAHTENSKRNYLRRVTELYSGTLLPGFYNDWILPEQERLNDEYLLALLALADVEKRSGNFDEAIALSRRVIANSPLDARGHYALVTFLASSGQGTAAGSHIRSWEVRFKEASLENVYDDLNILISQQEKPIASLISLVSPSVQNKNSLTARALPAYFTRFFGREGEIEQIGGLLDTQSVRLITLIGPAGVGKTRLAVAALEQRLSQSGNASPSNLPNQYPDASLKAPQRHTAVFYVLVESVADGSLITDAILEAVQASYPSNAPRPVERNASSMQTLAALLNSLGRPTVLVLDGCEHLAEDCAVVMEELLLLSRDVTVLATSRHRLLVRGAHVVPIEPLPLQGENDKTASLGDTPEEEGILRCLAVALFRDRAKMAYPGFEVTQRNARAVMDLVSRLDGLPLALELAAARARFLTPAQMLDHLQHEDRLFDLLKPQGQIQKRGREVSRHPSLHEAISWSFDLLPPELKQLFAELSVFEGSWTLDDATAICDVISGGNLAMLDALTYLSDLSLIQVEAPLVNGTSPQQSDESMRFRLLSALRAFASEKLLEISSAQNFENTLVALKLRHARHYLAACWDAERSRQSGGDKAYLDAISRDYANLRAAIAFSSSIEGDINAALELGVVLSRYWLTRGRFAEARVCLNNALAVGSQRQDADKAHLAEAWNAYGVFATMVGDANSAREHNEKALALFRAIGNVHGAAKALTNLANLDSYGGNWDAAKKSYKECLVVWEEEGNTERIGTIWANLGGVAAMQGNLAESVSMYERSLAYSREANDHHYTATRLRNLARVRFRQRHYDASLHDLWEALDISQIVADTPGIALCLVRIGLALRAKQSGNRAIASLLVREGIRQFTSCEVPFPDWEREELLRWPDLEHPSTDTTGQKSWQDAVAFVRCPVGVFSQ